MKTTKFNDAIIAFDADFDLAVNGQDKLADLDKMIEKKDKRFLHDINLLSELAFGIRYGTIEIHEVEKENNDAKLHLSSAYGKMVKR